jgi:hypothetical protein
VAVALSLILVVTVAMLVVRPSSPVRALTGDLPAATAGPSTSPPVPAPGPASPSVTPSAARSTAPAAPPPAGASSKKGVATWNFAQNPDAVKAVGAAWYYNWSASPAQGVSGAEYVPMVWGAASVTASNLNRAKASGRVLLGFNEPDLAGQANLTVEKALELWPQLQATGLRLGSPAVATGGATAGGWLDRFLAGARERGFRVDFIALHWYGSDFGAAAVGHLSGYLKAVYERYRLPIWLTEFALIKFGGGGPVYPSAAQLSAFINGSTAMLARLSYVERYAWFSLPTPDEGGDGTGLYKAGHGLTAAGATYRLAG